MNLCYKSKIWIYSGDDIDLLKKVNYFFTFCDTTQSKVDDFENITNLLHF